MKDVGDRASLVHTGPGTLAGRFLRRFWHPVRLAGDLEPGRPRRIRILDEHFTLYRGESGTPYLVADRCAHRGTQLSLGWVEGECIRCFYHGWVFDGAGQCVEQPAEKEQFAAKVRIASYPVQEYLGLVFVYVGEGEPPPLPRFPEIEDEEAGTLRARYVDVPCNYLQRIENDVDEAHIHFVHKAATEASGLTVLPEKIEADETDYGFCRKTLRAEEGTGILTYCHFFMPNTIMVKVAPNIGEESWPILLAWRVPIDDENCLSLIVTRFSDQPQKADPAAAQSVDHTVKPYELTEAILAGDARIQNVDPNYLHAFTVQDNVVLKGQGRVYLGEGERLGQSDLPVIRLRQLYERELKALAEGRPLKEWKRPADKLELGIEARAQLAAARG